MILLLELDLINVHLHLSESTLYWIILVTITAGLFITTLPHAMSWEDLIVSWSRRFWFFGTSNIDRAKLFKRRLSLLRRWKCKSIILGERFWLFMLQVVALEIMLLCCIIFDLSGCSWKIDNMIIVKFPRQNFRLIWWLSYLRLNLLCIESNWLSFP